MGDTRAEMIDAAERLAAEGGLAAMSLRAVQEAAGQRNKSAAQYHFGSRDGLLEAIVSTRMAPINERRSAMLDDLDDDPDLDELVRVLIAPLADAVVGGDTRWARFLQLASNHPVIRDVIGDAFEAASYLDVRDRITDAVPLPEPLRTRRVDQMLALVLWVLAQAEANADDSAFDLDDLVAVSTAVLTAPDPSADHQENSR